MTSKTLRKILIILLVVFGIGVLMHSCKTGTFSPAPEVSVDNNSSYNAPTDQTEPEKEDDNPVIPEEITNPVENIFDNSELVIHYLDTGNSDCILIQVDDKNFIIDAGDKDDGEAITAYLRNEKVDFIDALILTHPHADHIGSATAIIKNFNVGAVYMPRIPDKYAPTTKVYKVLLETLIDSGIPVKSPNRGDSIAEGDGYSFFFLNSSNEGDWQKDDMNKYSLMTYLTFKGNNYIFDGDADKENEDEVLRNWPELNFDTIVLKAGHHCSRTASGDNWIGTLNPDVAICMVGKNNSYGHPHQQVLAVMKKYSVTVMRSDEDGTIKVTDNGRNYKIEKGLPSANGSAGKE